MTPEQQAKAEADLDRYASSLIETLGINYREHQRYREAVKELALNPKRGALSVITDIREAHAYFTAAK